MSKKEWLTVVEAAAALGISTQAVYKRCLAGTLPARRTRQTRWTWRIDGKAVRSEAGSDHAPEKKKP